MKTRQWLPIFLYLLGLGFYLVQLFSAQHQLPPRVANSFNFDGRPISWINTHTLVVTFAWLAVVIPLPISVPLWFLRLVNPKFANVPHADYWRQPKNWQLACDFLFSSSFWIAVAVLVFLMGLFSSIATANQHQPPSMGSGPILALSGVLTLAILVWTVGILLYFYRAPLKASA